MVVRWKIVSFQARSKFWRPMNVPASPTV